MKFKKIEKIITFRERVVMEIEKQYDYLTSTEYEDNLRNATFVNETTGLEKYLHIENRNSSYLDLKFNSRFSYRNALSAFNLGGFEAPYIDIRDNKCLVREYIVETEDGRTASIYVRSLEGLKRIKEGKPAKTFANDSRVAAILQLQKGKKESGLKFTPGDYFIAKLGENEDKKFLDVDYFVASDFDEVTGEEFEQISAYFKQMIEIFENIDDKESLKVMKDTYARFNGKNKR